jgi:hypothetical protein
VDADGHPALAADALGEADVVRVGVGQQHRAHVRQGAAHARQFGRQVSPVARQAGVDDGHPARLFHEVAVDEAVAEAMQ